MPPRVAAYVPIARPAYTPSAPLDFTLPELAPLPAPRQKTQEELDAEYAADPRNRRSALGEVGTGLVRGALVELPGMVGRALQATGREGDTAYEVGRSIEQGTQDAYGRALQQRTAGHNAVTNAFAAGAGMLAPSAAALGAAAVGAAAAPVVGTTAAVGAAAGSAAAAVGLFGASQYQDTYRNVLDAQLKKGASQADAEQAAHTAGLKAGAIEAAGEEIGTMAGYGLIKGVGNVIGKTAAAKTIAEAKDVILKGGLIKPLAAQYAKTAAVETGTEMGQNYGEAVVEKNAGVTTDPYKAATDAIGPTLAMTTMLLPFGAHASLAPRRQLAAYDQMMADPNVDIKDKWNASKIVGDALASQVDGAKPDTMEWRMSELEKAAGIAGTAQGTNAANAPGSVVPPMSQAELTPGDEVAGRATQAAYEKYKQNFINAAFPAEQDTGAPAPAAAEPAPTEVSPTQRVIDSYTWPEGTSKGVKRAATSKFSKIVEDAGGDVATLQAALAAMSSSKNKSAEHIGALLSAHIQEIQNAQQNSETGQDDGGSSPQPGVRQEGGNPAQSGAGVQQGGREGQGQGNAPSVQTDLQTLDHALKYVTDQTDLSRIPSVKAVLDRYGVPTEGATATTILRAAQQHITQIPQQQQERAAVLSAPTGIGGLAEAEGRIQQRLAREAQLAQRLQQERAAVLSAPTGIGKLAQREQQLHLQRLEQQLADLQKNAPATQARLIAEHAKRVAADRAAEQAKQAEADARARMEEERARKTGAEASQLRRLYQEHQEAMAAADEAVRISREHREKFDAENAAWEAQQAAAEKAAHESAIKAEISAAAQAAEEELKAKAPPKPKTQAQAKAQAKKQADAILKANPVARQEETAPDARTQKAAEEWNAAKTLANMTNGRAGEVPEAMAVKLADVLRDPNHLDRDVDNVVSEYKAMVAAKRAEAHQRALDIQEKRDAARGDEPSYSYNTATTIGTTVSNITAVLRRITGKESHPNVNVWATAAEARAAEPIDYKGDPIEISDRTQGFAVGDTVHLIAENIQPGTEMAVFLHEVGSHLGMQRILSTAELNKLIGMIRQWAASPNSALENTIAKAAMARAAQANAISPLENLAYFIEEAVNHGVDPTAIKTPQTSLERFFQTIMNAFKTALAKLGLSTDNMTAQDIVDLAYGAAHLELNKNTSITASTIKADGYNITGDPTRQQAENLLARSKAGNLRGLRDPETGKLYIWDAHDAIHFQVAKELSIKDLTYERLEFDKNQLRNLPNGVFAGEEGYGRTHAGREGDYLVGDMNMNPREFDRLFGAPQGAFYSLAASATVDEGVKAVEGTLGSFTKAADAARMKFDTAANFSTKAFQTYLGMSSTRHIAELLKRMKDLASMVPG